MNEQENEKKGNGFGRKNVIRCVCFLLVFALIFSVVQELFRGKWLLENSMSAATSWYDELEDLRDDTVDVFFVGTSHTYSSIDPMYMYENTGLTGMVLATGSMRLDLSYLYIEAGLGLQNPEYVVLDMSAIRYTTKYEESVIRKTLDQFPLNKDKISYILDNEDLGFDLLSGVFPFFRYHSRWNDLTEEDFLYLTGDVEKSCNRGHVFSAKVVAANMDQYYEDTNDEVTETSMYWLERISELCEEHGATLVFMKTTSPDWTEAYSKKAQEIADQFGVDYINLASPEAFETMGIDVDTDFRDSTNHTNQYGAEKTSIYLANWLTENYNLEDHRGEYTDWDEDLVTYNKFKTSIMKDKDAPTLE